MHLSHIVFLSLRKPNKSYKQFSLALQVVSTLRSQGASIMPHGHATTDLPAIKVPIANERNVTSLYVEGYPKQAVVL